MVSFRFDHVCLEAFGVHLPDQVVTSSDLEERLAPLYKRLKIPAGTLERVSGIKTRRVWDAKVRPSTVATTVAKQVLGKVGFVKENIKALFNCSVTRDYFEPATATVIHGNLDLPEQSFVMDISNACMGFVNGIMVLGNLIESGAIKAGVLVSGENVSSLVDSSINHILSNDTNIDRDELLKLLPTFTLGCAAVCFVMCHDSIATTNHRIVGGAARSATQFNDLCEGNGDHSFFHSAANFKPIMYTESSKIISSAASLGARTWKDASQLLGWTKDDVDHIFCHQVGRQVNSAFYEEMGLDIEKEHTVYQKYGNLVSASLPVAFSEGVAEKNVQDGEKILLTGFGSGLNSLFVGIEW